MNNRRVVDGSCIITIIIFGIFVYIVSQILNGYINIQPLPTEKPVEYEASNILWDKGVSYLFGKIVIKNTGSTSWRSLYGIITLLDSSSKEVGSCSFDTSIFDSPVPPDEYVYFDFLCGENVDFKESSMILNVSEVEPSQEFSDCTYDQFRSRDIVIVETKREIIDSDSSDLYGKAINMSKLSANDISIKYAVFDGTGKLKKADVCSQKIYALSYKEQKEFSCAIDTYLLEDNKIVWITDGSYKCENPKK